MKETFIDADEFAELVEKALREKHARKRVLGDADFTKKLDERCENCVCSNCSKLVGCTRARCLAGCETPLKFCKDNEPLDATSVFFNFV